MWFRRAGECGIRILHNLQKLEKIRGEFPVKEVVLQSLGSWKVFVCLFIDTGKYTLIVLRKYQLNLKNIPTIIVQL